MHKKQSTTSNIQDDFFLEIERGWKETPYSYNYEEYLVDGMDVELQQGINITQWRYSHTHRYIDILYI